METMESVQEAVRGWRRGHAWRRGPLPVELRRRAGALATQLGDDKVGATLEVEPGLIQRWRERYALPGPGVRRGSGQQGPTFVEVEPEVTRSVVSRGRGTYLLVEVSGPYGRTVRIQGAIEAPALMAVVRCALGGEVGGGQPCSK